jgi:DNA replication protein DnaC
LDEALTRAEREGRSPLPFVPALIGEPAPQRRERSVAHRLGPARFREQPTRADFDGPGNAATLDRRRRAALATGAFRRRRENLVRVGQSGVGQSHRIPARGPAAWVWG